MELKYESCSDVESDASECMVGVESETEFPSDEDDTSLLSCVQLCDCQGGAHKQTCFLNPRNRNRKCTRSLQLGQYVCVHNRKLGNCHVVCRIVDVVGECYWLYCLSGVLDKAFSSYELTPVASERDIPLDNWRKAGKVSMHSLATDKLVGQPCNCSLPPPPESIVIDSEGEAEQRATEVWVKNELFSLIWKHEKLVRFPNGWLIDEIIEAAQLLVLQEFPTMCGLQCISLQEVSAFEVLCGEFVQVINVRGNHWCCVSTVGCEEGVVQVDDSMCSHASVSDDILPVIAKMLFSPAPKLNIRVMDVAWQTNGSDCGVCHCLCV